MLPFDLPRAEEIAERVHPDLPEDPEVFTERLQLFPQGCLILALAGCARGYAIGHPWVERGLPKLNALLGQLPARPDTFFVHDLALLPDARHHGHAAEAVRRFVQCAEALGLPSLSLVAVGASSGFWRRQGFVSVVRAGDELASYGDACAMVRPLRP